MRAVDLKEWLFLTLIVHHWILLDHLNLQHSISCVHLPIKINAEALYIIGGDRHILFNHVDVEVSREIMDVRTDGVSGSVDAEQANHRRTCVLLLVYIVNKCELSRG